MKLSAVHDGEPAAHAYSPTMKGTYAVKWREPDGQTYLGRLTLGPRTLRLEGREPDGPAVDRQIGYEEVRNLRVGSSGPGRLDGRPTLVVERTDGPYLVASAGMGAGIVQELVERLAELRLVGPRRATLVVPLKDGAGDRVHELAGHGPPFDPAQTALTRHQLLLTEQEAIFVFEAQTEEGLKAVFNQVDIWAAAAAWQDLVAGPPRLAELAYAWERPEPNVVPAIGLGL
ncbi:hypothetical protein BH18ACT14_BH18ACT14_07160 [soil metagenome]